MKKQILLILLACHSIIYSGAPGGAPFPPAFQPGGGAPMPNYAPGGAPLPYAPGGAPFGPNQMPPMSEEDMLKQFEEIEAEIAKQVSMMSPAEQEKFYKDVDAITQYLNNVDEKDLPAAIEELMSQPQLAESIIEGGAPAPMPAPIMVEPTPAQPQPEKPKVIEAEKIAAENTEKALKLLNNLITRIERFLRKAQSIPELAGKIATWVGKDKIKEWRVDVTWNTLKKDLNNLVQKLHAIKSTRDPKTATKYVYHTELVKQEALFNNLMQLSNALTKYEPNVQPSDDLQPVSKESRTAIKQVLGALAEALYTMDVNKSLDTVIATFEPRAKEFRAQEETFAKQAIEESKKPRKEVPGKVIGGARDRYAMPDAGGVGDYYRYNYATPGGYDYGYPPIGGQPHYDQTLPGGGYQPGGQPFAGGAPSGPGGLPSSEGGISGSSTQPGKDGQPGASGEQPQQPGGKEAEPDDSQTKDQLKNLKGSIEKLTESFDKQSIATLDEQLAAPVDTDLIKGLAESLRHAKKAVSAAKGFNLGITRLSPGQIEKLRRELVTFLKDNVEGLDAGWNQLELAEQMKASFDAAHRFAYFADKAQADKAAQADPNVARIKQPANISELFKELQSLDHEIAQYREISRGRLSDEAIKKAKKAAAAQPQGMPRPQAQPAQPQGDEGGDEGEEAGPEEIEVG